MDQEKQHSGRGRKLESGRVHQSKEVDVEFAEREDSIIRQRDDVSSDNNNIFFNVQRDFLAQTGDPTNTGKGGESAYQ